MAAQEDQFSYFTLSAPLSDDQGIPSEYYMPIDSTDPSYQQLEYGPIYSGDASINLTNLEQLDARHQIQETQAQSPARLGQQNSFQYAPFDIPIGQSMVMNDLNSYQINQLDSSTAEFEALLREHGLGSSGLPVQRSQSDMGPSTHKIELTLHDATQDPHRPGSSKSMFNLENAPGWDIITSTAVPMTPVTESLTQLESPSKILGFALAKCNLLENSPISSTSMDKTSGIIADDDSDDMAIGADIPMDMINTHLADNPDNPKMPYKCIFPGCKKQVKCFARRENAKSHIASTHLNDKAFKCKFCNARFTRQHDCKRHEGKHAPDEAQHHCTCAFSTPRKDALTRHWKRAICPLGIEKYPQNQRTEPPKRGRPRRNRPDAVKRKDKPSKQHKDEAAKQRKEKASRQRQINAEKEAEQAFVASLGSPFSGSEDFTPPDSPPELAHSPEFSVEDDLPSSIMMNGERYFPYDDAMQDELFGEMLNADMLAKSSGFDFDNI